MFMAYGSHSYTCGVCSYIFVATYIASDLHTLMYSYIYSLLHDHTAIVWVTTDQH